MLEKAVDSGIDWVQYLPMASSAIRVVPNRDTGQSPYELCCTLAGWRRGTLPQMCTWVESLVERLKVLSEMAVARNVIASSDRKLKYVKGKSDRSLCVGEQVLMRVTGLHGALESSWMGPYQVVKVVSRVTYFVRKVGGGSDKLVHINNLKCYRARPASVSLVCIVA